MYIPEQKYLEGIGFNENLFGRMIYESKSFKIRAEVTQSFSKFDIIILNYMGHQLLEFEFYPKSIGDIQNQINLLTK